MAQCVGRQTRPSQSGAARGSTNQHPHEPFWSSRFRFAMARRATGFDVAQAGRLAKSPTLHLAVAAFRAMPRRSPVDAITHRAIYKSPDLGGVKSF
jgi:hypothetical protein